MKKKFFFYSGTQVPPENEETEEAWRMEPGVEFHREVTRRRQD